MIEIGSYLTFEPTTNVYNTGINGWIPIKRFQPIATIVPQYKEIHKKVQHPIAVLAQKVIPALDPPVAMTAEEYKNYLNTKLHQSVGLPKELPVKETIGKYQGKLMDPHGYAERHSAAPLLKTYAEKECPVNCGKNRTREHIELMLQRGPHKLAKNKKAIIQLRLETKDKIAQGYTRVVKWKDIKQNMPPNLKVLPVAMVPHKSRPFWCILDLSFQLKHKDVLLPLVNSNTTSTAKPESMVQLGKALTRILQHMVEFYHPNQPFYFAKLDIKDGFWRLGVHNEDAWNFCYVLPSLKCNITLDEVEIVIPNCLQMGWKESPPLFCLASETARDVIVSLFEENLPPHPFENQMIGKLPKHAPTPQQATIFMEVYVDDFIGITNDISVTNILQVLRSMLHRIHSIFPPPRISHHGGCDPILETKLDKNKGQWATIKEILGWTIDGNNRTIQLLIDKCNNICQLIRHSIKQKIISLLKF